MGWFNCPLVNQQEQCLVNMTTNHTIRAEFSLDRPDEFALTIQKQGSGDGLVTSNPSGVSCGSDCDEMFVDGTIVTLDADPVAGSTFVRWLSCPSVNQQDQCVVEMTTDRTVRAEFSLDAPLEDMMFTNGFES